MGKRPLIGYSNGSVFSIWLLASYGPCRIQMIVSVLVKHICFGCMSDGYELKKRALSFANVIFLL